MMNRLHFISPMEDSTGQMEKSSLRYRTCFEHSRDAMNIFSLDRKILDANQRLVTLSGYSKKELLSMSLQDLYPESLSVQGEHRLYQLKSKQALPLFESTLVTKTNRQVPVEIAVTFLEDWKDGELVCQASIRDISRTKNVVNRLKSSKEKYRSLIETLDAGIARSTPGPTGRYIEHNMAMADILGYPKNELFDTNTIRLMADPELATEITDSLAQDGCVRKKEIRLTRKDGNVVTVSYTGNAIKNNHGHILYIDEILVDITAQKKIEEEVQKNEKLRSIGDLAGGIAHHFNNIMTGIFGNISLAKMELPKENPVTEYLSNAEVCMQEGISLTRQLLTFAKGGEPVKEQIDLAQTIRDTAGFSLSGSNIRLDFKTDNSLWQIRVDKSQISQVFSNIIMNARQAMPEGGNLTIAIEKSHFLKDNLLTISKGRYLKIVVQDNGSGIHHQDLDRIFDPYFSTRKNGSGMGLSICYSIVKKHDGHIFVSSQLGAGTTITLYLPADNDDNTKETPMTGDQTANTQDRQLSILVMDDEAHIRNLLKKMLEKFGYHVELCSDGEDAIRTYRHLSQSGRTPDLVIMDLTIPGGMGGKEASQKILANDPNATIVVSSGYSNDPVMANYRDLGLKGIIPKPYRMQDLKTAILDIFAQNDNS